MSAAGVTEHGGSPPPGGEPPRSTLTPPPRVWWKRLGPDERRWLIVAFVWCLVLFSGMYVWLGIGEQQTPIESYRITTSDFAAEADTYIADRQVGEQDGVPVVEPIPGEDVYLVASQFQFRPILRLQRDETYRLLVSSTDVQHGLSLQPTNLNFQVLPGYLYVIRVTPDETGEFPLVCNEFCGLGHHVMTGKIIVED